MITFHLFFVLRQRKYCCYHRYHYAEVVENATMNFSISTYYTLLFSRKENLRFFDKTLSVALCNGAVDCIMNVWGYQHWNIANTTLDINLLFENGHKSSQTRCKVCSNLTKCTTTIDFRLTSVFVNLEHLSHPTLVLLFIIWKCKCWLKLRRELFVKIIVMLTYTENHVLGILLW